MYLSTTGQNWVYIKDMPEREKAGVISLKYSKSDP